MKKFFSGKIYRIKNTFLHFVCKHYSERGKVRVLKRFGTFKGEKLVIKKNIWIEYYDRVLIGDNCGINSNVKFYVEGQGDATITIEDNVAIARDVTFETGFHEMGPSSRRSGPSKSKSIIVGEGSWIGVGSFIGPGVKIGKGCMIQAGSVILKNCKDNHIYGGNPAKVIADLSQIGD